MKRRTFNCKIQEGTYDGHVTVSVDAESIEIYGNQAIEDAAWKKWRDYFGPSVGMASRKVTIVEEVSL